MKKERKLSILKYCIPCKSKCCKTSKFIGSPILSEDEASKIGKIDNKHFKKVIFPAGKKYYIIKGLKNSNRCFFLTGENKCKIQNSKPLDCLCYPIKAIYDNHHLKFRLDDGCSAANHLTKDFIEYAKKIATKSIMRFDKRTYQHWLDNYVGWIKKGVDLPHKIL